MGGDGFTMVNEDATPVLHPKTGQRPRAHMDALGLCQVFATNRLALYSNGLISFRVFVPNVLPVRYFFMIAGMLALYFLPSQCAVNRNNSFESLSNALDGLLVQR